MSQDGSHAQIEDVNNLQAICQVTAERAIELLEAASGSLQRAVDFYLQGSVSVEPEIVDMSKDESDAERIIQPSPAKRRREWDSKDLNKQASKSPQNKGKQIKIHSFFGAKGILSPTAQKKQDSPAEKTKHKEISPVGGPTLKGESKPITAAAPLQVDPRLRYATLAEAFGQITKTSKRNEKLNILKKTLVGIFQAVGGIHGQENPESRADDAKILTSAVELIAGKISLPGSQAVAPVPLQVSGAAVSSAIQTITGVSRNGLRGAYRRTGDLGDAAAEFYDPSQSVRNFFVRKKASDGAESTGASLEQVHRLLQSIATVPQGTGSQKERHSLLVKLMRVSTSKEEIRFLTRALIGNMRLGATTKSILAALAMAIQEIETQKTITPQDPVIQKLQKAYDICPKMDRIATALLCGGVDYAAEVCSISVGIPIQPMLANPAHSLDEVDKFMMKNDAAFSSAIAEWKYDGVRCQAHFDGSTVRLFSRHLHDSTAQFPDAIAHIMEARSNESIRSFIIDSEIVAVANSSSDNKDNGFRLLPFQVLSTRRGTNAITTGNESGSLVQVRVFAFDLMYLNGDSMLERPLFERCKSLRESFCETPGFTFASSVEFNSFDESQISTCLQRAVEGGAEGLMIKLTGKNNNTDQRKQSPDDGPFPPPCIYESGARSRTWLKVKRDYVKQFADTIDVVPIGAWYGSGRKAEKGFLSPILFAVYDEDEDVYRSISRCMSFTDEMYRAVREFYFNGTRFPSSLSIGNGEEPIDSQEPAVDDGSGPESEAAEHDRGEKQEVISSGSHNVAMDDSSCVVRVNCFPYRPSSAVYVTNENPPIWFKPLEVWEVSFADLTLSRVHTAAAGLVDDEEGRGVAMRFPRFIRRRPDKSVEQATTSAQIAEFFANQYKFA